MTFGEKVKYVRGELQLSQIQLAAELGISFATVNSWETQNIEPRFLTKVKFDKFCEAHCIFIEKVK